MTFNLSQQILVLRSYGVILMFTNKKNLKPHQTSIQFHLELICPMLSKSQSGCYCHANVYIISCAVEYFYGTLTCKTQPVTDNNNVCTSLRTY